jgi:hypothetical protein
LIVSPRTALAAGGQPIAVGQVLRGQFVQDRQLAGFAKPLRSEGSFVLVAGTGLIWRTEKPFAGTTVITPAGIVQVASGQVAMHLDGARIPGLSRFYDVLGAAVSGNIQPLQQVFSVTQSQTTPWRIVLTPLHPDNPAMAQLKSLTLTGGRFVDAVDVDKGGGDVDHIVFRDQHIAAADLTPDEKALLDGSRR